MPCIEILSLPVLNYHVDQIGFNSKHREDWRHNDVTQQGKHLGYFVGNTREAILGIQKVIAVVGSIYSAHCLTSSSTIQSPLQKAQILQLNITTP